MTSEQKRDLIAALIRERAGYEQYGHTDRVAEVDAELAKLGHRAKPPAQRAQRMTRPPSDKL
jgi:hypothetical protein